MKKLLILLSLFVIGASANTTAKEKNAPKEFTLKIGTYNVWSDDARRWQIRCKNTNETRNWQNSREALADLIAKLDWDIMAIQESTKVINQELPDLVKSAGAKKYAWWFESAYPEGHKTYMTGPGVAYRKDLFKLSNQKCFWISETPTIPSTGWDEVRHMRMVMTAVVTHKKSKTQFFLMAFHGPLKPKAKVAAARIITEVEQAENHKGLPVIFLGDMNAWPDTKFYEIITKHFDDSFEVAEKRCETIGTFHSSQEVESFFEQQRRRIDFIFLRGNKGSFEVKSYDVNRDKYNCGGVMHYPSDHNPVGVVLKIKQ